MELHHFKWDVQVGDVTALAPFPLLITRRAWEELAALAERLTRETLAIERELLERPGLHERLALPSPLSRLLRRRLLRRRIAPTPPVARVMRFDFHWTTEGWRVSEVNSDVPGGFTESTQFTALMAAHAPGAVPSGAPTQDLVDALVRAAGDGAVALASAPGHMEDHQVVAYLAAQLRKKGLAAHVVSPRHLRWRAGHAHLATAWCEGPVAAIVRFYQAEWLARLPHEESWAPLFAGGHTPVLNPGIAVLSESKRLPLVFPHLGAATETWRQLLPETRAPEDAPWRTDEGWLLKSAYGNAGDTVSIRSAMSKAAWARLAWAVRWRPGQWVAQRRFTVVPVEHPEGPLLPCIGVYTVDGRAAGAYARITRRAYIDFSATDVALLVVQEDA
jgi:glutathionylspermidine synthase